MKVLTILTSITLISTSSCLLSPDPECPKDNEKIVLLPNTDDCSCYWICKKGFPILKACPYGTLFDTLRLACVSYETAMCAGERPPSTATTQPTTAPTTTTRRTTTTTTQRTTIPTTTTTTTQRTTTPSTTTTQRTTTPTTTTTQRTTTPTTTTTQRSTTPTTTTTLRTSQTTSTTLKSTTLPPAEHPVDCPPQLGPNDNFFLPNPKDCHTFYQCAHGVPYLHSCPGTLLFNSELSVCDYSYNVNC